MIPFVTLTPFCYLIIMARYVKNAWKQKIDPAFAKLVKVYVAFLSDLERSPNEGRLNLPDDFVDSVGKNPDRHDLGDLEQHGDLLTYGEKTGMLPGNALNTFLEIVHSLDDYDKTLKTCFPLIESLPEEESRHFYTTKLNNFKDDPEFKPNIDIMSKSNLDYYSIIISLLTRYLYILLFKKEEDILNEEIDFFKNSNAKTTFITVIQSFFSQMAHQMTLEDLKQEITAGDDKAIFKAVSIDKTFLNNDAVAKRVSDAQLTGDTTFLGKLGRAMERNPLKTTAPNGKLYSVLRTFWLHGLYRLTISELHDFLTSCGLKLTDEDGTLQKYVKRHIKPLYSF